MKPPTLTLSLNRYQIGCVSVPNLDESFLSSFHLLSKTVSTVLNMKFIPEIHTLICIKSLACGCVGIKRFYHYVYHTSAHKKVQFYYLKYCTKNTNFKNCTSNKISTTA